MKRQAFAMIEDYNKKNGLDHNKETVFPHLIEEVGELARELNHGKLNWRKDYNKNNFEEELIDVLIQILILANDNNVNIGEVFERKIKSLRARFELDG